MITTRTRLTAAALAAVLALSACAGESALKPRVVPLPTHAASPLIGVVMAKVPLALR